jgi:hypothetical protein
MRSPLSNERVQLGYSQRGFRSRYEALFLRYLASSLAFFGERDFSCVHLSDDVFDDNAAYRLKGVRFIGDVPA